MATPGKAPVSQGQGDAVVYENTIDLSPPAPAVPDDGRMVDLSHKDGVPIDLDGYNDQPSLAERFGTPLPPAVPEPIIPVPPPPPMPQPQPPAGEDPDLKALSDIFGT